ncbi:protein MODIFIER OF SNC1 11-like isoform X2 [Impatiens glandulifera]|uniref:protein MODIFIER OF SNC1 11-like isoform X2 n=1 Tax=Impatiens glandulifera TaxID=253017 RepID=UPI001FB11CEC|nr:protein MODIFIER OF SNC1 11-like isoform X2 [Impatiens glandulifera]
MTTAAESKNPKITLEQPKHDSTLDQISMNITGDTPIGESIVSSPPTLAAETVSEGTESMATVKTDSVVSSDKGEIPATTDVEKKIRRAERFGVPVQLSEQEKRNTRAERFGTASTTSESVKNSEDQKRKTRAERFGTSVPATATAADEAKKKARLERFAAAPNTTTTTTTTTTVEDEKRKARAIRFSQPTASISQVNGEGDKKTAIAGNVGNGT